MKLILYTLLLFSSVVFARVEIQQFDNPQQEQDYKQLIAELRCLVCQNQNLADSDAELAMDLRAKTYEMVKAGKQRDEIVSYMVDRYGDYILYNPPLKPRTFILWYGPFILLIVVVASVIVILRKRSRQNEDPPYSSEQLEAAEKLLSNNNENHN